MTRLDRIARVVFHEHDDKLLGYLKEEGQSIEPQWCLQSLLDYHHMQLFSGLTAAGLPQGGSHSCCVPGVHERQWQGQRGALVCSWALCAHCMQDMPCSRAQPKGKSLSQA